MNYHVNTANDGAVDSFKPISLFHFSAMLTHTRTKLPMRMLPFSHFNQQMYSESSHRRSSTSKASTHTNTHTHPQTSMCADTHTPTAPPTHC